MNEKDKRRNSHAGKISSVWSSEQQSNIRRSNSVSFGQRLSRRNSKINIHDAVETVVEGVEEAWLLTKLAYSLIAYMGIGYKWIIRFFRLVLFILILTPGFLKCAFWYIGTERVTKSIIYGTNSRNNLDVFVPPGDSTGKKYPVIVFYSGGAWIIGYKNWGILMAKVLSEHGILFITPDYRNFPQGRITDMLDDVNNSMSWVLKNCEQFGGDPDNVYICGQSAGAHISCLALLTEAERERRHILEEKGIREELWNGYTHDFREHKDVMKWNPSKIKGYIGISGAYDIAGLADYFHSRGLYRGVLSSIMCHDLSFYSPTRRVGLPSFNPNNPVPIKEILPPLTLFHGTNDESIPVEATSVFSDALNRAGLHPHVKYYKNKSHTDPIVEDPLEGGWDILVMDIYSIITAGGDLCRNNPCSSEAGLSKEEMSERMDHRDNNIEHHSLLTSSRKDLCYNVDPTHCGFEPTEPIWNKKLIQIARNINPF